MAREWTQHLFSRLGMAALIVGTSALAKGESTCPASTEPSKLFVDEYERQTGTHQDTRPKVLLSRFSHSNVPKLRESDISQRLPGQLASHLVDAGAIVTAETDSTHVHPTAEYDFKVRGTIQSAGMTSRYQEENTWQDNKGKKHAEPAQYVYTADVAISLEVLDGKERDKVLFVEAARATTVRTVEAKGHQKIVYDRSLVEQALEEALKTKLALLQNRIARASIIVDVGERDGKKIFEITAGAANGIKPNQLLKVYRVSETTSAFSGITKRVEEFLGDAATTDHINATHSWIVFSDADAPSRVCPRTLYIVKREFDKTFVKAITESSATKARRIISDIAGRVTNAIDQAVSSPEPH